MVGVRVERASRGAMTRICVLQEPFSFSNHTVRVAFKDHRLSTCIRRRTARLFRCACAYVRIIPSVAVRSGFEVATLCLNLELKEPMPRVAVMDAAGWRWQKVYRMERQAKKHMCFDKTQGSLNPP